MSSDYKFDEDGNKLDGDNDIEESNNSNSNNSNSNNSKNQDSTNNKSKRIGDYALVTHALYLVALVISSLKYNSPQYALDNGIIYQMSFIYEWLFVGIIIPILLIISMALFLVYIGKTHGESEMNKQIKNMEFMSNNTDARNIHRDIYYILSFILTSNLFYTNIETVINNGLWFTYKFYFLFMILLIIIYIIDTILTKMIKYYISNKK